MKASEYSFCANADLSTDGTVIVHGVPEDAETWCTDEDGAIQVRVQKDGLCEQISGPVIEWDDLEDLEDEASRHFTGVQVRFA